MILTQLEVEQTKAYELYKKQRGDNFSEIYYLIHLVKHSPYRFDRDGKLYNGDLAAFALKQILNKEQKRINSAEGFIQKLSSYMDQGGESCEVVYPDGSSTPAAEVLYYELARLREHEKTQHTLTKAGEGEPMEIAYRVTQ